MMRCVWLENSTLALGTTIKTVIKIMGKNGCGTVTWTTADADSVTCAWRKAWALVETYSRTDKSKRWHGHPLMARHTQIDHVIINSKWTNLLLDVKVRRGADAGSDHQLLMATLAIKLRKTKRQRQHFSWNSKTASSPWGRIGEHDLSSFHREVREAGEKILGFRRRKKEERIQQGIWDKITERKKTKEKIDLTRSERLKHH